MNDLRNALLLNPTLGLLRIPNLMFPELSRDFGGVMTEECRIGEFAAIPLYSFGFHNEGQASQTAAGALLLLMHRSVMGGSFSELYLLERMPRSPEEIRSISHDCLASLRTLVEQVGSEWRLSTIFQIGRPNGFSFLTHGKYWPAITRMGDRARELTQEFPSIVPVQQVVA